MKSARHLVDQSLPPLKIVRGADAPCACGNPTCDGEYYKADAGRWEPCPLTARRTQVARAATVTDHLAQYRCSWDDLEVTHESWRFMRAVCDDPVGLVINPGLSLLLIGPRGTGKTQAAVMFTDAVVAAGCSARFVPWGEWWTRVTASYRDDGAVGEGELIRELTEPDVVVLDDVGGQIDVRSARAWALFERIVSERYHRGRPLVLTTNLSAAELAVATTGLGEAERREMLADVRTKRRSLHELPSPAFSRLEATGHSVIFDGPNYRRVVDAAARDAAVRAIRERQAER